jgi:hypothetical protein
MRSLPIRVLRSFLVPGVAAVLAGCVGLVVSSADYHEISIEQKRKADVVARFGEPARREQSDGHEVWLYKLVKQGVAGPAVGSTSSAAYLVLYPVYSTSTYADNLRVYFSGDEVIRVEERRAKSTGIACGVPSHAFPDGCYASFGADRSTPSARPPAAAPASGDKRAALFITAQAFFVDGAAFTTPDEAAAAVRRKSAAAVDVKACPLTESGRVVDALASLQRSGASDIRVIAVSSGQRDCTELQK